MGLAGRQSVAKQKLAAASAAKILTQALDLLGGSVDLIWRADPGGRHRLPSAAAQAAGQILSMLEGIYAAYPDLDPRNSKRERVNEGRRPPRRPSRSARRPRTNATARVALAVTLAIEARLEKAMELPGQTSKGFEACRT